MLDELTEGDLQPVKSVSRPGMTVSKPSTKSTNKVLQDAVEGADKRGEALIHRGLAPRPPFLMFLGGMNLLWSLIYFGLALLMVGLLAIFEGIEEEVPEATGIGLAVIAGAMIVMGLLCIATCAACFVRAKWSWYVLLFSYSYGFADRLAGAVGEFMSEEPNYVRVVVGIIVGLSLWAYMHGDEVRAFCDTEDEPMGGIIGANVAGFVFGALLAGGAVFLAA